MSTLCKLDFPLYCCDTLDESHIVVAGGGGASKTGVPNTVEILKLQKVGRKCFADPCERLSTESIACMNLCALQQYNDSNGKNNNSRKLLLAVGLAGKCLIYSITRTRPDGGEVQNTDGLRKRKQGDVKKKKGVVTMDDSSRTDNYSFKLLHTLETDFSNDPMQKAVRMNTDLLVTGGSDGYIRVWKMPAMENLFCTHGHKDDVTDVDISPDGKHVLYERRVDFNVAQTQIPFHSQIVSVSRDGSAIVSDSQTGMKIYDLHLLWNSQMITRKYRFRCCRYGTVVEDPKRHVLFTAHCPTQGVRKSDSKSQECCLTKWARKKNKDGEENPKSPLRPAILRFTGKESISSMTIGKNGVFLGVGFMEGSVAIYIAFSLQCAKRVSNLHGIFVTGLTFVNDTATSREITGRCDSALVSISADNTCKLTKLASRTMFPAWIAILFSALALVLTALYLQSIGVI